VADNRRSSTRHDVELDATLAVGGAGADAEQCKIMNLSLGGAYLVTRKLGMGERVHVTFRLPTLEEPVATGATVRWTTGEGVGVQFDGLRARDVWALGKFFESLPQ
jgi:PilZ domain